MRTFPMVQVDAFTREALAGNACAVIFDADELDAPTMQRIAREMNLSETAFVLRSEVADVRARYFTPAEEIPLAGHPTIATLWALVESGRLALDAARRTFRLELPAGVIEVEVEGKDGVPTLVTMTQLPPTFREPLPPGEVLPVFGLTGADLLPDAPVQVVSTGTPQLMVALRDHDALRRVQADAAAFQRLRRDAHFFSAHLFVLAGATPQGDTFARHLVPPPDIFEDPFTGSATGGMAAYLWHHALLAEPRFCAEQGHWMGRPGAAQVELLGPRDAIRGVRVGGPAVTVLEGTLRLP